MFFSNFYVGRIIKNKAEYICRRCCIEGPNRERKKTQNLSNCRDWVEKNLGMTQEKQGGAVAKVLPFATPCHREQQGREVKWQICKDSPRTESSKFWASPLASVQGVDALWVRAGFVRWQNSLR